MSWSVTISTSNDKSNTKIERSDDNIENIDVEVEGVSLVSTETTEFTDPAILAAKPAVTRIKYSKEELTRLRQAPHSLKKPETLNPLFDIWQFDRKSNEIPSDNNRFEPDYKRRTNDPRERVRKEQDGIVLSPQRRSFNSGCFVPIKVVKVEMTKRNRSDSPLGVGKSEGTVSGGSGGGSAHIHPHREIPAGTRRIGSGRILSREVPWDYQDKQDADADYGYRRDRRDTDRDERYERRSYGRDNLDLKDKDKQFNRGGRFGNDRRKQESREEEPEWFSGGPSSQHDTIELRGFDEETKKAVRNKKPSPSSVKRSKERAMLKNKEKIVGGPTPNEKGEEDERSDGKDETQYSTPEEAKEKEKNCENSKGGSASPVTTKEKKKEDGTGNGHTFDALDAILESQNIPSILTNGIGGEGDTTSTGSRFSRFFKSLSPPKTASRNRDDEVGSGANGHHDEYLLKNILRDMAETKVSIPSENESSFAPISPAAYTGQNAASEMTGGVPSGKVLSLEELEAKMLQQGSGDPGAARISANVNQQQKINNSQQSLPNNKVDDEMAAFKRLLAQVSGGHAVTATNGPTGNKPPMSLLEMLSHSQQQEEMNRMGSQIGPLSPNLLQAAPHIPNDLVLKLQQAQSHVQQQQQHQRFDILSKLMNASIHPGQQPIRNTQMQQEMNQGRDLLGRPEAQAILQGLKRGDITPQHLYQQLANPAMQPRHRELLLTIIKLHGGGTAVGAGAQPGSGIGPSPRVLSPVPSPHAIFAAAAAQHQQQQQLRISPLPPTAIHQRIPSPRELQVHTQNIMQRALIKKKLEEQQENFKKRQEMQQRGQSPVGGVSPAKQTASPTPLAFTPTSVLRKMTAEKDEGSNKEGKNLDGQSKNQGRPLVGIKSSLTSQQNQQQWNVQQQQQQSLKQPGRPIVKANSNYSSSGQQQPSQDIQQFFQQQRLLNQQQQQRHKMNGASVPQPTGVSSLSSSHHHQHNFNMLSNHQMNTSHHVHHPTSTINNPSSLFLPNAQSGSFQSQQSNHLTHQQLRAQHQQQQPANHQQPAPQSFNNNRQQWGAQQQQRGMFNQFQNFDNRAGQIGRGGVNGGGDLSPTSNQLARWFSSDLLERARAGKLPNMPNSSHAQHAINLEEIERQTAAPIHN